MARTATYTGSEIATEIGRHAREQLTPEEGAARMGVSVSTYLRYLSGAGGWVTTRRSVVLPARDSHSTEDSNDRG